jgi:hypothetical protein
MPVGTRITQATPYGFMTVELESENPRTWKATIWKNGNRLVSSVSANPLAAAESALKRARFQSQMNRPRWEGK